MLKNVRSNRNQRDVSHKRVSEERWLGKKKETSIFEQWTTKQGPNVAGDYNTRGSINSSE